MLVVRTNTVFKFAGLLVCALAFPGVTLADDILQALRPMSGDSVIDLSRRGEHYLAIKTFRETDGGSSTVATGLAAAQSAWALGLVDEARRLWDDLLNSRRLSKEESARVLLSRAMLEMQEKSYESARAFAERGAALLQPSELRAQLWLVVAESLVEQGITTSATEFYERAKNEGAEQLRSEAAFRLGECQLRLGRPDQARFNFTSIPLQSEYAQAGLGRLVQIDFREKDYDSVLTWLKEGQQSYPREFDSPSFAYTHISALLEIKRLDEARAALREFKTKYSAANPWYILAEAAYEARASQ